MDWWRMRLGDPELEDEINRCGRLDEAHEIGRLFRGKYASLDRVPGIRLPAYRPSRPKTADGRTSFHFRYTTVSKPGRRGGRADAHAHASPKEQARRPAGISGPARHQQYIERSGPYANRLEDIEHDRSGPITAGNIGVLPDQRVEFWNRVVERERRDGQVQVRIVAELPHEVRPEDRRWIVRSFAAEMARRNLPVSVVVHRPDVKAGMDPRNYHLHAVMHDRPIVGRDEQGRPLLAARKDRSARGPAFVRELRVTFAGIVNETLDRADARDRFGGGSGIRRRYDPRPYWRMGIDAEPCHHLGARRHQLERSGIPTRAGARNAVIEMARRRERHFSEFRKLSSDLEMLERTLPRDIGRTDVDVERRARMLAEIRRAMREAAEFRGDPAERLDCRGRWAALEKKKAGARYMWRMLNGPRPNLSDEARLELRRLRRDPETGRLNLENVSPELRQHPPALAEHRKRMNETTARMRQIIGEVDEAAGRLPTPPHCPALRSDRRALDMDVKRLLAGAFASAPGRQALRQARKRLAEGRHRQRDDLTGESVVDALIERHRYVVGQPPGQERTDLMAQLDLAIRTLTIVGPDGQRRRAALDPHLRRMVDEKAAAWNGLARKSNAELEAAKCTIALFNFMSTRPNPGRETRGVERDGRPGAPAAPVSQPPPQSGERQADTAPAASSPPVTPSPAGATGPAAPRVRFRVVNAVIKSGRGGMEM